MLEHSLIIINMHLILQKLIIKCDIKIILTLIIINIVLFYLNDKNIYKCYTTFIYNLFDIQQKKVNNKIILT